MCRKKYTIALIWLYVLLLLPFLQGILHAGPIITIDDINTGSYPQIYIHGSIKVDKDWGIHDITEDNFIVLEDGDAVNTIKVEPIKRDNAVIALCLDSSKSISKKSFNRLKRTAAAIISGSPDNFDFIIYKFNDTVSKIADINKSRRALLQTIDSLNQHGSRTKLINCLFIATEDLSKFTGSRSIILLTDGKDEGSYMVPDDILDNSRKHEIPIYTIVFEPYSSSAMVNRLSKATKGNVFVTHKGIENTVNQLISARSISISGMVLFEIRYTTQKPISRIQSIGVQFKHDGVSDSDVKLITIEKPAAERGIDQQIPVIVLAGIVVLLITALVIVMMVFINKWKHIVELLSMQRIPQPVLRHYTSVYEKDETARKQQDSILLSTSPEYNYTDAWLVVKSGPETGKRFPLIWDEITIGRCKENAITIEDEAISSRHVKIKRAGNAYYLFDCASDNGTFLNNKKLLRPKPLSDWDEILIGRTSILFRGTKS